MKEFNEDFICGFCNGKGFTLMWGFKTLDIKDCEVCGGSGRVRVKIRDSRQISDDRELDFERKYWQ